MQTRHFVSLILDVSNQFSRKRINAGGKFPQAIGNVPSKDLIPLYLFILQCLSVSVSLELIPQLAGSLQVWSGPRRPLFLRGGSPRPRSSAARDVSCQATPRDTTQKYGHKTLILQEGLGEITLWSWGEDLFKHANTFSASCCIVHNSERSKKKKIKNSSGQSEQVVRVSKMMHQGSNKYLITKNCSKLKTKGCNLCDKFRSELVLSRKCVCCVFGDHYD